MREEGSLSRLSRLGRLEKLGTHAKLLRGVRRTPPKTDRTLVCKVVGLTKGGVAVTFHGYVRVAEDGVCWSGTIRKILGSC
jgi:hypothetical protein